jgi:hypothetical protein
LNTGSLFHPQPLTLGEQDERQTLPSFSGTDGYAVYACFGLQNPVCLGLLTRLVGGL